ncbi:MAG: hypothetical protein ACE5E8_11375 [Acidimicrobiia bacterium]
MAQAQDVQSTAQTDTSLVAAPGAGKQVVVIGVYISTDTAQTVSFESGTASLRWRQYCAANGGGLVQAADKRHLFTCADNAALTYTSSAAGNVFVSVQYEVRGTFDLSS